MGKFKEQNSEAVSPVVGVMLMLVVTIVIAAIVSAFAGGTVSNTEKAPTATFDAAIDLNFENIGGTSPNIRLNLVSGDSLDTGDLQIVTYYHVPTFRSVPAVNRGKIIKHTIDGSLTPGSASWDDTLDPFTSPQVNDGGVLGLNAMGSDNSAKFGQFIWKPGRYVKVWPYSASALSSAFGFDITDEQYGFKEGAVFDIEFIHKPSGKPVFKKTVEVTG